jgi:DNA-directed RNA polymerase subunit H (RpoH/RPB5)
LDDRDLERYAEDGEKLPRIARSDVAARFGFVSDP